MVVSWGKIRGKIVIFERMLMLCIIIKIGLLWEKFCYAIMLYTSGLWISIHLFPLKIKKTIFFNVYFFKIISLIEKDYVNLSH